jgi:hypothetical protein
MSDPFARAYATAGNPYIAADGMALNNTDGATVSSYRTNYGEDAAIVFAEVRNQDLLAGGQAVRTNDGVMGLELLRQIVQQHGYVGPNDLSSWAQFYNALKTPPPATPTPSGSATISVRTGLGGLPTPVLIGGGVLLLLLLGGRGRLL